MFSNFWPYSGSANDAPSPPSDPDGVTPVTSDEEQTDKPADSATNKSEWWVNLLMIYNLKITFGWSLSHLNFSWASQWLKAL